MKKHLICLILALGVLFLLGCQDENAPNGTDGEGNENNGSAENGGSNKDDNNEDDHEHSFTFVYDEEAHVKHYTCGCNLSDLTEPHTDSDHNNECDVCLYAAEKRVCGLVMETYTLPYYSTNTPTYITFYENGKCIIGYSSDNKEPYVRNYWIDDGRVYLDIEGSPKVHVFTIFENALVYDPYLTTASLWSSTYYNIGAVVYFLPDVSEDEMLCTIVMANEELMEIPGLEKIYKKYSVTNEYTGITNDVYAFMPDKAGAPTPHADRIIGTDYTFTYSDSREILVYTQGRLMTLNKAFDKQFITEEILSEINKEHQDCGIAHSYDDGVIIGNEIIYTCHACDDTKAVILPDDFSFSLTYSFDLSYDSSTGHLENGYNYNLDKKCEATLIFDHSELMEIYRILYNGNLFEIKDDFFASEQLVQPNYNISISYTINGENVKLLIRGASYLSYSEWQVYPELCFAYERVVKDFIMASEEYNSLPPNTNVYE